MDFGAEVKDKADCAGCELPRRSLSVLSGVGTGEDALEARLDLGGKTPRSPALAWRQKFEAPERHSLSRLGLIFVDKLMKGIGRIDCR